MGFICKKGKKDLKVEIPSWRPDINHDVDLIEELIRIKRFKNIKMIAPERKRENETLTFNQKLFHLSQGRWRQKDTLSRLLGHLPTLKLIKNFQKVKKKFNF